MKRYKYPVRRPIFLRLDPNDKFDFQKFVVEYANRRPVDLTECNISNIDDPAFYFRDTCVQQILEHGLTTYLKMDLILEEVTTPRTPPDRVEEILIRFLTHISIDNELIIIDPYFFAPRIDASCVTRVCNIIQPFISTLTELKIVTASHSSAYSANSKNLVVTAINSLSPGMTISHTQSNELHDRFWISNKREKGILNGTSLNGLGKKYAVIDYLEDDDVKAIISDFSSRQLI